MATDGGGGFNSFRGTRAANDEGPGTEDDTMDEVATDEIATDGGDLVAPDWQPSRAWLDQFGRQWTQDASDRLSTYARHRAAQLQRSGIAADARYVEELIADIVGDIFTGVLAWEPERVDLERLVYCAIRGRTAHHVKRARRAPHLALDSHRRTAVLDEAERTLADLDPRAEREANAERAAHALAELRKLAAQDPEVLAYIDDLEARHLRSARGDLARRLGPYRYRRVRERFGRLTQALNSNSQFLIARRAAELS